MVNKRIESMTAEYRQIEIPQELSSVVSNSIAKAERELAEEGNRGSESERMDRTLVSFVGISKRKKGNQNIRRIVSVAAVIIVVLAGFGVGINISPAFAETMAEIPVLDRIAKLLTIKEIHEENDVYVADLKIPGIEGLADEKLQAEINRLVQQQINVSVSESTALMEDDKAAWLAAGGKESDYIPRHIEVDHQVNCLTEDIISFTVFKTETGASAYFDLYYYNYDLKTGKPMTLENMLGPGYEKQVNTQIRQEIEVRSKEKNAFYFDGSDGIEGFSGVSDNQPFYVNEARNPVIVFNKYEIAPGYMGIQEFEIVL